MNQVIETIKNRRSVRQFEEKPVSREDLTTIAEAAAWAPSGNNYQTWRFTVISDGKIVDRLNAAIRGAMLRSNIERYRTKAADETLHCFYHAPAVIIASNDPNVSTPLADCAVALENAMLAATSLGIGSCWVNQVITLNDDEPSRAIRNELGIPENHALYGSVALGYGKPAGAPPRKKGTIAFV